MNPLERDDLIHWLAVHIDADEPPGLAASKLARTVLEVVENRDGPEAVLLERDIALLAQRYRRQLPDEPQRTCTTCNFLHPGADPVPAKFVAAAADGSEWYECGNHPPTENALERLRVSLIALDIWQRDNGLLRELDGQAPR